MNNHSTINGPSDPIHDALCDDENYLNQEDWFRSLQDDGIGFTALDDSQWEKKSKEEKVQPHHVSAYALQATLQTCSKYFRLIQCQETKLISFHVEKQV